MKQRERFLIIASVLLAGLTAIGLIHGIGSTDSNIIMLLRAPRIATAILAGAALASAGTQMQSILRNPLADPHIMGVSSGAALGAALATLYSNPSGGLMTSLPIACASFIGALVSAMIIIAVSKRFKGSGTLLIFGVMLGFISNAVISILQLSTDAENLKVFYNWSAGSFSHTTWSQIAIMSTAMTAGVILSGMSGKGLDIILFGDEFAEMAGADTKRIRIKALLSCCILTGAVTTFCGPIGFVGIVAPHIARNILKSSAHRKILPAAMLTGAIISLTADLTAQLSGVPIPTGSAMAMIGIPIIFYVMFKKPTI